MANALCGICDRELELFPQGDAEDHWGCAVCGHHDRLEDVMEVLRQFAEYETAKLVEAKMADVAKGNSFLKFTPGKREDRVWLYKVELDL